MMNTQIVFKPSKKTVINACISGTIIWFGMIVCFIAFERYYVASIPLCCLLGICESKIIVAYCRTIVFDNNGIKVSFMMVKKEYLWEDVVTKKIFNYKNLKTISRGCIDSLQYSRGVVFSPKTIKKKLIVYPEEYCCIFHPWTCIFINFDNLDPSSHKKTIDVFETYVTNENSFKAQLLEWGIEMEPSP